MEEASAKRKIWFRAWRRGRWTLLGFPIRWEGWAALSGVILADLLLLYVLVSFDAPHGLLLTIVGFAISWEIFARAIRSHY
jgi:hypothetical protein